MADAGDVGPSGGKQKLDLVAVKLLDHRHMAPLGYDLLHRHGLD